MKSWDCEPTAGSGVRRETHATHQVAPYRLSSWRIRASVIMRFLHGLACALRSISPATTDLRSAGFVSTALTAIRGAPAAFCPSSAPGFTRGCSAGFCSSMAGCATGCCSSGAGSSVTSGCLNGFNPSELSGVERRRSPVSIPLPSGTLSQAQFPNTPFRSLDAAISGFSGSYRRTSAVS